MINVRLMYYIYYLALVAELVLRNSLGYEVAVKRRCGERGRGMCHKQNTPTGHASPKQHCVLQRPLFLPKEKILELSALALWIPGDVFI